MPAREGEAGAPVVAEPAGSASSASAGAVGEGPVPAREGEAGAPGGGASGSGEPEAGPRPNVPGGHDVTATGTVVWCRRCGAYGSVRVGAAFNAPCPDPKDLPKSRRSVLSALLRGKHPKTGKSLLGDLGV